MSVEKYPYAARSELIEGTIRYFTAFVDGTGAICEAEIPQKVYLVLEECRRDERRQLRSRERHHERLCLSEAQLAERAFHAPLLVEDQVAQTVDIQAALDKLTDTQRRRFLLYYEHELSMERIAMTEDRAIHAVEQSINAAFEKLKIFLRST